METIFKVIPISPLICTYWAPVVSRFLLGTGLQKTDGIHCPSRRPPTQPGGGGLSSLDPEPWEGLGTSSESVPSTLLGSNWSIRIMPKHPHLTHTCKSCFLHLSVVCPPPHLGQPCLPFQAQPEKSTRPKAFSDPKLLFLCLLPALTMPAFLPADWVLRIKSPIWNF